jgi:predicted transcriptional regulator YdeE
MQKTIITRKEFKVVGSTTRTSNACLAAAIAPINTIEDTIQKYFHNRLSEKIYKRKNPGITLCFYTHYESDFNGEYTFLIGEEVEDFETVDWDLRRLEIPEQRYVKFTSEPGPMPSVCTQMWQNIWKMSPADLGGERSYIADFEVYDERSHDPSRTILDIYIGLK